LAESSAAVSVGFGVQQLHAEICRLESQFANLLRGDPAPFQQALAAARNSGSDSLLARSLCLWSRWSHNKGRLADGIALAEEALALYARMDKDTQLRHAGPHSEAWRVAGNGWMKLGDIATALPLIERAIAVAELGVDAAIPNEASVSAIPSSSALVRAFNNLGMALLGMRETAGAREALQQAMAVVEAHPETLDDIPDDIVYVFGNLVEILQQEATRKLEAGEDASEELQAARAVLEARAADMVRAGSLGNSKLSALAQRDYQEALAQNLLLEGQPEAALVHFQQLADSGSEDNWRAAIGERGLAEALLALGRPEEAMVHARLALVAYDRNEEIIDRANVHLVLSRIHRALGQDRDALISLEQHHRLRGQLDVLAARQYAGHIAARVGLERARADADAQRRIASELTALNAKLVEQASALQCQAQDLGLARNAAEEASRAKSAFLANMSHELRTPLNAILGFAEMMRDGYAGPPGPAWTNYASMVHEAGTHLLKVIGEILDLSKIEAGRVVLEIAPVDLADLFVACRELVAPMIEQSGLVLTVERDPALTSLPADETRLKQILLNLLSNATKFTPAGGRVTLSARPGPEGFIAISVADTGIGMNAVEVQLALEVFGQIETSIARQNQGTGLGLPIARSLAELHGGSLEVQSEKGVGTTVTITLPMAL